jgi:hypothetical protein
MQPRLTVVLTAAPPDCTPAWPSMLMMVPVAWPTGVRAADAAHVLYDGRTRDGRGENDFQTTKGGVDVGAVVNGQSGTTVASCADVDAGHNGLHRSGCRPSTPTTATMRRLGKGREAGV